MSKLIQLKVGETIVFDYPRQVWIADDESPLSADRTARATLLAPVNFYEHEGVRSEAVQLNVTEHFTG